MLGKSAGLSVTHARGVPYFKEIRLDFLCYMLLMFGHMLSRALKIGGVEVPRKKWDEVDAQTDPDEDVAMISPQTPHKTHNILPDWTRSPLPVGAPPARPPVATATPTLNVLVSPPHMTTLTVNA